jgi:hypothetical protein
MRQQQQPTPPERVVGLNVHIPATVHRAAKLACVAHRLTWDQAVAEALAAWAQQNAPR